MAQSDHINARRSVASILVKLYEETDNHKFRTFLTAERANLSKLGKRYLDAAVEAMGINREPPIPTVKINPNPDGTIERAFREATDHIYKRDRRTEEQKLIDDLSAIHVQLGQWASDLYAEGFTATSIKDRLRDIVEQVERD